jgi:hypothetical protein
VAFWWLKRWQQGFLLYAWIWAAQDSMFRRIARARDQLFEGFARDAFESALARRFELVRSCRLRESSRWLHLCEKAPCTQFAGTAV